MKKIILFLLAANAAILAHAQWSSNGDSNRGTQIYTSALGYSIRTGSGGGWAWQLVDGGNNSYFHVTYPTGNVGIGTTSPANLLSIQGTGALGSTFQQKISNGSQYLALGANSSAAEVQSQGAVPLYLNYGGNNVIMNATGGNVGIGTTSPGGKLHINGNGGGNIDLLVNGRITTGDASNSGGMWVNGAQTMFVGQYTTSSIGFYNNGAWRIIADNNGNVGIGTTSPDAKLAVSGQVHAQEVKVSITVPGPDYVFNKDYKLTSLEEVKNYIDQNKHLPEVPSAKEMEKNGVQLGEMNMLLLKKIEELTLYVIKLNRKISDQDKKIELQGQEIETLKSKAK